MDLRRLRPVFEEKGPFTTLHVEVGRGAEDAEERTDARWTRIRHELEHLGIQEDLLEAIGDRVRANTHVPGEVWRTVVAANGRILLDDVQPGHNPHGEVIDHGELPDLAAWLDQQDQALPFVLAVVDRTGADIAAHRALGARPVDEETVKGETLYITKVAPGGWSDRRYDQNVENTWAHNARLVAESIRSLALEHGSRATFVAGEVRARAEVLRALEEVGTHHLEPVIEVQAGGRGQGASDEALWEEVRDHVRACIADADADVAGVLDEARGRGDGAATGLDQVLEALAKAQVRRLVADLEEVRDQTVDPARHPGLPLPATAAASGDQLPADRVLVAATALTDAEVTLLPASVARGGGVAALLRWAD
jgi:hypothetical protein